MVGVSRQLWPAVSLKRPRPDRLGRGKRPEREKTIPICVNPHCVIKPIPPAKPMRIGKADGLPEVPDIRVEADKSKKTLFIVK